MLFYFIIYKLKIFIVILIQFDLIKQKEIALLKI